MEEHKYKRKQIHIWTFTPNPDMLPPQYLLVGYKESTEAMLKFDRIHTTQIILLDCALIRAGWDLFLYDENKVYVFDLTWYNQYLELNDYQIPNRYELLDQYRYGLIQDIE